MSDKPDSIADVTVPLEECDFQIVALVNRKWYNPMRYIQSKHHPRKAIVRIVSPS